MGVTPVTKSTRYEPVAGWAKLPQGVTFHGDATSVAVDSHDRVYVFNRGPQPVVVFDRDGNFVDAWGAGDFDRPHSIEIDSDDNVYLVDDRGHFIQKRNAKREVIFTLGSRGKSAPWQSGGMFNRPTDIAINPANGALFVSDGYGNSRVHEFDSQGKHVKSWGEPGVDAGQFSLPHNICMIGTDRVAVCDRENFRVQIFTTDGEFVSQFHTHRPSSITSAGGSGTNLFIGESRSPFRSQEEVPNVGHRVTIWDSEGNQITRFGGALLGQGPDQLIAPHGIAVDSYGDVYVAEATWSGWASQLPNPPLGELVSLRKWRRVPDSEPKTRSVVTPTPPFPPLPTLR